ncbi:MAG TPA: hypothetical protein VGW98_06710 [Solirubrobacteraceae bacterium]|nr:hypothetical protein [Solirubrobacteraceae bacterium]
MSTGPIHRVSQAQAARTWGSWRSSGRWAILRRRRLGSCPVCHGRVLRDDAIGIVGRSVAHAECALVSWLGAGRLSRELL